MAASKYVGRQEPPPIALGIDGDYYTVAGFGGNLYQKDAGAWILVATATGPVVQDADTVINNITIEEGGGGGGEGEGEAGPPGLSAYEVAVENGFVGTEAEWLASLVGPPGENGEDGEDGADGAPGAPGANGSNGTNGTNGADGVSSFRVQDLRLTTESGVPVSTTNRTAQSTIYLTPFTANQIGLYISSVWTVKTTAEISLALSGLTSGKNYDVFAYWTGSAVALELSAAWTNDTTRADAIALQDGIAVKSGTATRRLVGTIRTTGTTTTEDSLTKRYVWNYSNRLERPMQATDGTDTWSYGTGTIRQANANTANKLEYVTGDAGILVSATVAVVVYLQGTSARNATAGVGVDSTTTYSGLVMGGYNQLGSGIYAPIRSEYKGYPGLGCHYLSWNEFGSDGTCIFAGDNGGLGGLQGGIMATVWC